MQNKALVAALLGAGIFGLTGCDVGTETSSSSSTSSSNTDYRLCYDISGSSIRTLCKSSGTCSSSGMSYYDDYSSRSSCSTAESNVLSHFRSTGSLLSVSSNSNSSSPSSSSSSTPSQTTVNFNCGGTNFPLTTVSSCVSSARSFLSAACSGSTSSLGSACRSYVNCLGNSISDPSARAQYQAAVSGTCSAF